MQEYKILIVDDDPSQRKALAGFLDKQGYAPSQAESAEAAIKIVQESLIDLVLTDMRMPGMDGMQLLMAIKDINPEIEVIVITAYGSIETATMAMKAGAADFITKPIDLEQLQITIDKVLERKQLTEENKRLRNFVDERLHFEGIISASGTMSQALSIASRAAASKATVLILGESGTGKELIAKAIHLASPRADKAFIAVNMAALSDNLVESELFGHEKGAFTGANQQRKGRIELADGGTLFIDEVGDIPASTQVKLLRVLQEHQIERIGSATPISVDVRVIAATNRNLEEMIKAGTFREDLYYRLNVVKIHIPPLRDRREDIPLLVDHFVRKYRELNAKEVAGLTREAMDHLLKYDYPGNVRELENIIEQAVVLCRQSLVTLNDLPLSLTSHDSSFPETLEGSFKEKVEAFEKQLIAKAMHEAAGVKTRAAESLGMTERHLRYKLQKYKM